MTEDFLPFVVEDDVRSIRGLGDSGTRVKIIAWAEVLGHREAKCPHCGYDRVREVEEVNPTMMNAVERRCDNCGLDADEWLASKERERERERAYRGRDEPMKYHGARKDDRHRHH